MSAHPIFTPTPTVSVAERRAFHQAFVIDAEFVLRMGGFTPSGPRYQGDLAHLAAIRRRSVLALKNHPSLAMTGETP